MKQTGASILHNPVKTNMRTSMFAARGGFQLAFAFHLKLCFFDFIFAFLVSTLCAEIEFYTILDDLADG